MESNASLGQLNLMLLILWSLWTNRTDACILSPAQLRIPSALRCVIFCITVCNLLKQLQSLPMEGNYSTGQTRVGENRWKPPPNGSFVINTDASFSLDSREACLGVVIRDHTGAIIVSASRLISFVSSALYAEVHAILYGFELALEFDLFHCIFQSDCLIVMGEIKKTAPSSWEGACLIHEIRDIISLFDSCFIVHISRDINYLAHSLAQCKVNHVWCGKLSPGVCNPDSFN